MRGITTTTDTKRYKNVSDVDNVNNHRTDARLAALGNEEEERITSESMEIYASKDYYPCIRAVLRKHENLWSGKLGNILSTSHRIDLITGARPSKSAPYRTVPKAHELDELEI